MGFKNGCYATVWTNKQTNQVVDMSNKYAEVILSTSKKSTQARSGYETDFNKKVRFIGRAFEKIATLALAEKDKLHLLEVETTTKYDPQTKKEYINFICWDFEPAESKNTAPRQPEVVEYSKDDYKLGTADDSELPF